MNEKLIKLAERRGMLIARAAAQRTELTQALAPWRRPLALGDQGVAALRYFRRRPMLLGGMLAGATILRPRRMFGWLRRGWFAWRMAIAIKRRLS